MFPFLLSISLKACFPNTLGLSISKPPLYTVAACLPYVELLARLNKSDIAFSLSLFHSFLPGDGQHLQLAPLGFSFNL